METAQRLEIVLNGSAISTAAPTLARLLDERGYGGRKIATALNGAFVSESARASTALKARDRVEIVSARQGG